VFLQIFLGIGFFVLFFVHVAKNKVALATDGFKAKCYICTLAFGLRVCMDCWKYMVNSRISQLRFETHGRIIVL